MLLLLLRNRDLVLTREQFLDKVWGYSFGGESRTVDVHIRTLRQKLGTAGRYIRTIRGIGYKLEGIAGGKKFGESSSSQCPNNKDGHSWVPTGRTRPGKIWGDIWPDYEKRCRHCGEVDWKWRK